jgi:hypothetical protein
VREIAKYMPVGPQNRVALLAHLSSGAGTVVKPPIEWIAGRKSEFVNVVRFDGFTDETSLGHAHGLLFDQDECLPKALLMTICFLMVGS